MRVLSFDIWGDYGHFKKFHTTSSPLSFSLPPPTSVYGFIGAIAGFSKNEYITRLKNCNLKIAVALNNPVKKVRMGVNWIELKKSFEKLERAPQIKQEFLRDCSFRVYITGKENFLDYFKDLLIHHKSFYTTCMGISQCLANFNFTGEYDGSEKELPASEEIHISTAILSGYSIKIETGKTYHKERMPVFMTEERQVTDYREILFEAKGQSICIKGGKFIELEGGKVIVFIN